MARRDYDPARRGSGENDLQFDEKKQGLEDCCPECGSWSHTSCEGRGRKRGLGGAVLGIGVLTVGMLLLLDNLGLMEAEDVIDFWPMLLVLVGISHFLRPKGSRRWLTGSIVAAVLRKLAVRWSRLPPHATIRSSAWR